MSYQIKKAIALIFSIFLILLALINMKEKDVDRDVIQNNPTQSPTANTTNAPTPLPTQTPKSLPLSGLKVLIDPAHQKTANNDKEALAPWDNTQKTKCQGGTVGITSKINEYELNLQLALKLRDLLVKNGATVIMTRTENDVNISNYERAKMTNDENVNIAFRIHHNGYDNSEINGIEIYSRGNGDGTDDYKKRSEQEIKMAEELLDCLLLATGANKRFAAKSDLYTSINWTEAPCFIIEFGYITNPIEEQRLISDTYKEALCEGILYWLKTSKTFKFN